MATTPRRGRGSAFEFTGLTKGYPLLDMWMRANAALTAGGGEREVGLLRANVMGFMTEGEKTKLEGELQDLQVRLEEQRSRASRGELPTPAPMEWLFEALRIILKHADDADLFQTERIGGF